MSCNMRFLRPGNSEARHVRATFTVSATMAHPAAAQGNGENDLSVAYDSMAQFVAHRIEFLDNLPPGNDHVFIRVSRGLGPRAKTEHTVPVKASQAATGSKCRPCRRSLLPRR